MSGDFTDHLRDLFAPLGGVVLKRMFGGHGVMQDGRMIALVIDDTLYFKADVQTIPAFEAEECGPFVYSRKDGRSVTMRYWRAPERLLDDQDAFLEFARAAAAAAQRADLAKPAIRRRA